MNASWGSLSANAPWGVGLVLFGELLGVGASALVAVVQQRLRARRARRVERWRKAVRKEVRRAIAPARTAEKPDALPMDEDAHTTVFNWKEAAPESAPTRVETGISLRAAPRAPGPDLNATVVLQRSDILEVISDEGR